MASKASKEKRDQNVKGWFLTFPKNEQTKEELLEELQKIGEVEEYVIARELHQDGTPHLHAFVKFGGAGKRFKQLKFTKQGNYQKAKSWKAVDKYVKKGGDFISNIDTESAKQKKGKHNLMLINANPVELVETGEIGIMQLKSLLTNIELYKMLKTKTERPVETDIPTDKKRHIWLYGPSDSGKSTKLKEILLDYQDNHFQIPYNNDWNGYRGERVLWADEYKGQLTIQDLNRVCDGNAKMNTKGSTITLHKTPQVIICSNYAPDTCYHKAEREILETVNNRFILTPYNYRDHQPEP